METPPTQSSSSAAAAAASPAISAFSRRPLDARRSRRFTGEPGSIAAACLVPQRAGLAARISRPSSCFQPWSSARGAPSSASAPPVPGSHRRSLPHRVFFPSVSSSSVLLCSPRPEPCSSSPAGSPWCRAPAHLPRARLLPMAGSRQAGPSRLRDGGCSGSPARHGCSGNRGRPCSSSSSRLQRLRDGGTRSVFLVSRAAREYSGQG
jgi:hypothetical protein